MTARTAPRVIGFAMLGIVTAGADAAQERSPPQPGWVTDAQTGCRAWNASAATPNVSFTWTGACRDNLVDGTGVLQFYWEGRLWSRYEGEVRAGKREGRGVYAVAKGRYDGDFRGGTPDGIGVAVASDGGRYEGEWHNGEWHGRGILTWPNGNRYEGEFEHNLQQGRGVLTWSNGNRYEGEFQHNVRQGRGVFTTADGTQRYDGEWSGGKPHGDGVFQIRERTYDGRWIDGCFKQGNRRAWLGTKQAFCP